MSPREKRLLRCLLEKEKVFVKDLRSLIGSMNPAHNALCLRKMGWKIDTSYIAFHDRDGVPCRPGFYSMDISERERAREFLEKTDGAAVTAPSANEDSEHHDSKSSVQNITEEEKNDNPL